MFEIIKSAVSKIKNNEKEVHKEEVKGLSSIVALLVEAASVDGNIGEEEKSHISLILRKQLNLEETKANVILNEAIIKSQDQIEIWSKTHDIRKEMDYEERLKIVELMWEIVLVDEVLDVFESQLMRRVAGLFFVSDYDSGSCKKRAIATLQNTSKFKN